MDIKRKTIETKRLLLREFCMDDVPAMYENWAKDPEVTKYLTWCAHESVEVTRGIVSRWMEQKEDPSCHRYAITIKGEGEPIGSIDVVGYPDGCPEIGYCLSRKHWGKGYMTEAAKSFIDFLFSLGHRRIVIAADTRNIGSNRVIEKCGFAFTHQEEREHTSVFKPEPVTLNWYELVKES